MKMPELTHDELGALRDSIQQDGVRYPVLLDRHGAVIDGTHRQKICADLGLDCPTETLDVDDETADRLRITLNVARRQLGALDRAEMISWLASRHERAARAEAEERRKIGNSVGGRNKSRSGPERDLTGTRSDDVIAEQINQDLAKVGETMRVTRSTVEKSRRVANLSPESKQRIREGTSTVQQEAWGRGGGKRAGGGTKPRAKNGAPRCLGRDEDLGALARIRAVDAEHQYKSMLNAPPNKLNLPLIRRAEKIMELLTELIGVDPGKAVSQLPIERCREFTVAHAAWWSEFAQLCEERRLAETPDLPPRPYRPVHATLNPVVLGMVSIPRAERHLPPAERAVLDWMRAQAEPVTVIEIAVGLRNRSKQAIAVRVRTLVASGLVEAVGKAGKQTAYRAVSLWNSSQGNVT